ncbi:hypothetical protein [uncultured Ruegeria sp.]|uniref:hypothetical protein n=1 Tax=uncultured Ruegeria sp. TaxID=259304 RepID=UPI00261F9AC2|nr:hypothetical protein [uncultured Ruegeria sp.]
MTKRKLGPLSLDNEKYLKIIQGKNDQIERQRATIQRLRIQRDELRAQIKG